MLTAGQGVKKDVVLGADAHEGSDALEVTADRLAEDGGVAARRLQEPAEHVDRRALPRTVVAEQAEELDVM